MTSTKDPTNSKPLGTAGKEALDAEDLDKLTRCIQNREENIIEILVLTNKLKTSTKETVSKDELKQISGQFIEIENLRMEVENNIQKKYIGIKLSDDLSTK